MKTPNYKTRPIVAVLSVLAFVTVVAISPHAFAQQTFQGGQGQQNGIPLGSSYNAPANMSSTPSTSHPPANLTSSNFASNVQQGGNQIAQQSAQGQQNGIPLGASYNAPAGSVTSPVSPQVVYSESDSPYGPLQGMGWAVGMAVAGVLSGVGIWTAVRSK
jgi:hypothetical protein